MATGEVRKGDWSVFTDIIYFDFGDQRSRNGKNDADLRMTGPALGATFRW